MTDTWNELEPWKKVRLKLSGPDRKKTIDSSGFRRGNAPLAVTPATEAPGGFKITHVDSGAALWPNEWSERNAKIICDALLDLEGWDRPLRVVINDEVLRAKAERIVRA